MKERLVVHKMFNPTTIYSVFERWASWIRCPLISLTDIVVLWWVGWIRCPPMQIECPSCQMQSQYSTTLAGMDCQIPKKARQSYMTPTNTYNVTVSGLNMTLTNADALISCRFHWGLARRSWSLTCDQRLRWQTGYCTYRYRLNLQNDLTSRINVAKLHPWSAVAVVTAHTTDEDKYHWWR